MRDVNVRTHVLTKFANKNCCQQVYNMMCGLTSLGGVEELGVVLDDPADEGAPAHAAGPH